MDKISETPQSRRNLLRLAGAAVTGAAAAVALDTGVASASTVNGDGGTTADGVTGTTACSTFPRAGVSGEATQVPSVGVYASHTNGGTALGAYNNSPTAPTFYLQNTDPSGTVIDIGQGSMAIDARNCELGVRAQANAIGAWFTASGSDGVGLMVGGMETTVRLQPANTSPPLSPAAHPAGDLVFDGNLLWLCTRSTGLNHPATWRSLGGNGAAGAFYPIDPTRVYDSRAPQPSPGAISTGANRLIDVFNGRDLTTGAIDATEIVPAFATAVVINLTVTHTVGSGYLTVNAGGNTVVKSSAINWSASGSTVANMITVPVNKFRQVTVVCSPAGSADFILDVSGYYL
jgi:hypothetical protein